MITNLIEYLYNIKIDIVRKNRDNYIFNYNNSFYIFKETYMDKSYINYISYFLSTYNTLFHTIIKNKDSELVSVYNNKQYILMKINFNTNRKLLLVDIISNNLYLSYTDKNHFNWDKLWKKKIDQVEHYLNDKKISNINSLSIINYYISLTEVAVEMIKHIKTEIFSLTLCHKRMNINTDLYEFYCVDNLVIDNINRDVGEYLKGYIYSDKVIDIEQLKVLYNKNNADILIPRLIFPSYFFDIFDNYVINNKDLNRIDDEFEHVYTYESNLNIIIGEIKNKKNTFK